MSTTVVGDGIVGRRVTRLLSDRGAIVSNPGDTPVDALTPSLSKGDVVVLAVAGEHAVTAAVLAEIGVSVVSVGDLLDDTNELLALDDAFRESDATLVVGAAMSPGLSGSDRPSPRRAARGFRRDPRRGARNGGPGVRPPAPPGAGRVRTGLARRRVDRTPGREWARAVLVPRTGRGARLLPRRAHRSAAAPPRVPGRGAHQRSRVGDPSGSADVEPSDAPDPARRGTGGRAASRGPRRRPRPAAARR